MAKQGIEPSLADYETAVLTITLSRLYINYKNFNTGTLSLKQDYEQRDLNS